jgi:hypothetical protein
LVSTARQSTFPAAAGETERVVCCAATAEMSVPTAVMVAMVPATTDVALAAANLTAVAFQRFRPEMVTAVPPDPVPVAGEIAVTTGGRHMSNEPVVEASPVAARTWVVEAVAMSRTPMACDTLAVVLCVGATVPEPVDTE